MKQLGELPPEVHEAFAELRRREDRLRQFQALRRSFERLETSEESDNDQS